MPYYVSRQQYWATGDLVVEIAGGGIDYANPDMLCEGPGSPGYQWSGEYDDPRKALEAALEIEALWKLAEPDDGIRIEVGYTGGFTCPFEECPTHDELAAWAEAEMADVRKCDRGKCGDYIWDQRKSWSLPDSDDVYCSERCADLVWEDIQRSSCAGCGDWLPVASQDPDGTWEYCDECDAPVCQRCARWHEDLSGALCPGCAGR